MGSDLFDMNIPTPRGGNSPTLVARLNSWIYYKHVASDTNCREISTSNGKDPLALESHNQ